jgi:hypothetical protein
MTAIFFNDSGSIPDETTETQPLTGPQGEGGFGSLDGIQPMLKRSQRIGIAVASTILSLPAFLTAFAGAFFVYAFAVFGGYNGNALQAALKLLSSWKGFAAMIPVFLIIAHIALFIYLLIRFARGLALPLLAQLYCMTIVILAIGERIRLLIIDGNALFWFGIFSLPHVLCLFFVVWASAKATESGMPLRQDREFS